MRKRLFLLIALLLTGCGFGAKPTPTPTPRPTATPTPAPRYYPTLSVEDQNHLRQAIPRFEDGYFDEVTSPDGVVYKLVSLTVISTGKEDVIKAGTFDLDVVWVFEHAVGVAYYPLVVGVWDGHDYIPYYSRYTGKRNRDDYLAYLHDKGVLERGRYLYPGVVGDFVDPYKGIDWLACGDDTFCRLGRYMQETYGMDEKVTHQLMGIDPIPEGWALAWMWDAATDENTDPSADQKVNLPSLPNLP